MWSLKRECSIRESLKKDEFNRTINKRSLLLVVVVFLLFAVKVKNLFLALVHHLKHTHLFSRKIIIYILNETTGSMVISPKERTLFLDLYRTLKFLFTISSLWILWAIHCIIQSTICNHNILMHLNCFSLSLSLSNYLVYI